MINKDLIGKEIYGFRFEESNELHYSANMNKFINEVGVIKDYDYNLDAYEIIFNNDKGTWWYPANMVEEHLVKEISNEELKTLFNTIKNI